MKKVPEIITQTARKLRKESTKSEQILWIELQGRQLGGYKFLRQHPLYVFTEDSGLDRFIISDFVCLEKKLIIELDGSIHEIDEILTLDREKEYLVEKQGFRVIRFNNYEVLNNLGDVLEKIKFNIATTFVT